VSLKLSPSDRSPARHTRGHVVATINSRTYCLILVDRFRRTSEQWIKEGKAATHRTRLSCHRFRANEVRLLWSVIAYSLGNLLRRLVLPVAIQSWSLASLQQRIFKTGGASSGMLGLHSAARRKPLDAVPLRADSWARRATRMASCLIGACTRSESMRGIRWSVTDDQVAGPPAPADGEVWLRRQLAALEPPGGA
jgi:hypothetical protein